MKKRRALSALADGAPAFLVLLDSSPTRGLRNHILELLERADLHDVAGGLGLEDGRLASERVGALTFLGGRLVLDDDLGQAMDRERARAAAAAERLFDLIIEGIENGADIALRQAGLLGNAREDFGLCRWFGGGFRHCAASSRLGSVKGDDLWSERKTPRLPTTYVHLCVVLVQIKGCWHWNTSRKIPFLPRKTGFPAGGGPERPENTALLAGSGPKTGIDGFAATARVSAA